MESAGTPPDEPPQGGWVRHVPTSPEEHAARRAEARRHTAEHAARVASEHMSIFGSPASYTIEHVTLPASGWTFQWRSDGYFRILDAGELDRPHSDAWAAWEDSSGFARSGQCTPGDTSDTSWWIYHGAARPDESVTAWLADDTDIPVIRLGWLWIAECVSVPQPAFIKRGDETLTFSMRRPNCLAPAPFPFQGKAVNPRA